MSCNYYAYTTDANVVFDTGKDVEILYNRHKFEIHLAQTNGSVKPLLRVHSYSTFARLKEFLIKHEDVIEIMDEYGVVYNVDNFISLIVNDNISGKSRAESFKDDARFSIDSEGFEFFDAEFC